VSANGPTLRDIYATVARQMQTLTDEQLGRVYADLWTPENGAQLDAAFKHIAAQAQRIKELQN
jgi:hypothetical protein